MFARWKQKLEEKKAKDKAIAESQYWKTHPGLKNCLQAMRGSCTVAPMELHEAVIAAVNIALREDTRITCAELPSAFAEDTVYLVWDDEKLPVLNAPWVLVTENLMTVSAVSDETFLVSESLDRILWFNCNGQIKYYTVA